MFKPASAEEIQKAKENTKKPEVIEEQRLNVRYHVEHPVMEDRPKKFLEILATILKHTPSYALVLDQYAKTSMKCARCEVGCNLWLATRDPKDVPCYRTNLLLKIYKKYFTVGGKLKAGLGIGPELTDKYIEEMADSVYNCTACRKCWLECPAGIDHGLMTHLMRCVLTEIDIVPRALVVSTREQLEGKTGNTSAIPLVAIKDTLEFLEDDIKEEKGVDVKFPLDVEGAEYIFFAPVSDYMMEAESLMGIATVLHAAGVSWTIGTQNYDAINYGLFYSDIIWDKVVQRIVEEAKRLNVKKILIGECGHASRSAKHGIPTFAPDSGLEIISILELTHDLYKQGRIKFDPNVVEERVTYHDPCNFSRVGWIVEQPREIIRAFSKNFVEMTPNGRENFCCGGGGGTVSIDELNPYRTLISGKVKADQIRATGAKYCIAPCANCKKQLREVMDAQKVDCEIVGLHDLLYKAIILD